MHHSARLGATPLDDSNCEFLVWAPAAESVTVHIVSPPARRLTLRKAARGYFHGVFSGVQAGTLYFYSLDGRINRPDPASRSQPEGVHGPTRIVDPHFPWTDDSWTGLPLRDFVIYELHVGTYTPEGTFDALIGYLDELLELGITAIELMPVGQFPGERNWGYDGTYPFAAQSSYGGPEGFHRLADACHGRGLALILDVVYNHLGPEGNYLGEFGPYFTDRYRTPWGTAVNFDGPGSDEVRRYFIENALHWVRDFHVDALRLDALHAIVDQSARPFLTELSEAVHREAERLRRSVFLIAESDHNDVRLLRPPESGGNGLDAHWNDDFHHCLHTLLTGETAGYYRDFGRFPQIVKAFREGFVYSGEYSLCRRRRHGSSSRGIAPHRLVVFSQNHDQVGNRFLGDRLSTLVSFEALKLAAGAVILSPFTPLLFMGEEYGETTPFPYFVSHSDPSLVEAVRKGRAAEFESFPDTGDPPDPQSEETFGKSRLRHERKLEGRHRILVEYYRVLLRIRRTLPASKNGNDVLSFDEEKVLLLFFDGPGSAIVAFNFREEAAVVSVPWPPGTWREELYSAHTRWGGHVDRAAPVPAGGEEVTLHLEAHSLAVYINQKST